MTVRIVDLGGSLRARQQRLVRQETRNWRRADWLSCYPSLVFWFLLVFEIGVAVGVLAGQLVGRLL